MEINEKSLELSKNFVPPHLMNILIELGFNTNICLFGVDTMGRLRSKIAHSTTGDYVSWDNYDNHKPVALWQQAHYFLEYLETKGEIESDVLENIHHSFYEEHQRILTKS